MSNNRQVPRIQYCRHHDMVCNPRTHRWKSVPTDFISELLHADLPVDLVVHPCHRCIKPSHPEGQ
jgi:hypothetical protein